MLYYYRLQVPLFLIIEQLLEIEVRSAHSLSSRSRYIKPFAINFLKLTKPNCSVYHGPYK